MNNSGFVRSAYLGALHRVADGDGPKFCTQQLDEGTTTPEEVIESLVNSDETARFVGTSQEYDFNRDPQFSNFKTHKSLRDDARTIRHRSGGAALTDGVMRMNRKAAKLSWRILPSIFHH
jgi:hypothetical protein